MSSDNNTTDRKPLRLSGGTLGLKKTEDGGQVKQSFSHGRSKTVQVEVKRKRVAGSAPAAPRPTAKIELGLKKPVEVKPKAKEGSGGKKSAEGGLTDRERAARLRAVELAKKREEERLVQEQERARVAAEEAAKRKAEEEARLKAEEEDALGLD